MYSRIRRASLDVGSITNLKSVMAQLKEQHPDELLMAPHMGEKVSICICICICICKMLKLSVCTTQDFGKLMETALLPLLEQYNEETVKKPVEIIGVQVSRCLFKKKNK
jgi:hypothetical protein